MRRLVFAFAALAARLGAELRPHAEAYIAAGGPQAALVKRWLSSVR